MPVHRFEQFGGMLPAWDDQLLPPGQAALSVNGYLFSGSLQGWRQPKLVRNLTNSAARYAYRIPTVTKSSAVAYLLFQANAAQGDTATVGDVVYTFTATVKNANDVFIGGDAGTTAFNFLMALTAGAGVGALYGTGTTANPYISNKDGDNSIMSFNYGTGPLTLVKVQAPDAGAAFNSTPVAFTSPSNALLWLHYPTSQSFTTTTFQSGTNPTIDAAIGAASTWLEFNDPDTNVMKSPVVDDQFERFYFASPSLPPQYNTRDRIMNGNPAWLLGVPAPGCQPIVSVAGGGNVATLGVKSSSAFQPVQVAANKVYLTKITPTGAMSLNDVSFIPYTTNAAARFASVAYADNNGVPGALVGSGQVVTGVTGILTSTSSFLNPVGLLANTSYWVGIMVDTTINVYSGDGTATSYVFDETFSNGPSASAGTGTANNTTLEMWADLTTSDVLEARAYVYTWVSEYDEEGPPSPPTLVNGWSNGVWSVTLYTPPAADMGVTRNLKTARIYRTVSAIGGTTYFHVADVTLSGNMVYTDTAKDSDIALNYELPSTNWFPPPTNLQGIVSMPNGMAVGFKNNEIWFCEPYRPHAWPPGYVLTTEFPIVGLGVTGQSVVACTSAMPYVATGVAPNVMTLTKVPIPEPCISRGSILGTDSGVYFMSPNGLVKAEAVGLASNITEMWITRERWQKLTPQKNTRAILLVSNYFCYGTTNGSDISVAKQGFTIELSNEDAKSFSIWPQPGGHRLGFNQLTAPNGVNVDNIFVDPWTGIGLLIQNGALYQYDFTDQAPTMMPYKWRSKLFQQNTRKNFEAMKIFFSVPPGTPAQGTRNQAATSDPSWNTLGANQYGIVRVYADGNLVTTREIYKSGELMRLLSGFKYSVWQWEFEGRVNISTVQVGTSVRELAIV